MKTVRLLVLLTAALMLLAAWAPPTAAQDNATCLMCHEDPDLTAVVDGHEVSAYVDIETFSVSVHGELGCVDCHLDLADVEDYPHDEDLEPVQCAMCHDDVSEIYAGSLHGMAVARGDDLAPQCWDCHGAHDITGPEDADSRVTKFNIPIMCGQCHKEGTEVSRMRNIPQDSILTNYSMSIHGYGLLHQGLTVTAVCVDCHTAHNIRDHNDPKSSISRGNIARTCQQCHTRIEQVHKRVIEGELWEKAPNQVPVCVECHEPHQIRRVFYDEGVSNAECLKCHSKPDLTMERGGKTISLFVDESEFKNSIHRGKATCAQCHTGVSAANKRPCSTAIQKVDCGVCHTEVVTKYQHSMHGQLADRGDPNAPLCEDCHGTHGIRGHTDQESPTFPINVPDLCGECHRHGEIAAERREGNDNKVENYLMSIHGRGLKESGLVVTAMCTDCHTAHDILPKSDTTSSVNRQNISRTCGTCHNGIYEQYTKSIHSRSYNPDAEDPLPTCENCHHAHTATRTDASGFKEQITRQCGNCHEDVTESYFETFHGKVSKLGYEAAARCHDCHGAHTILPPDDIHSTLSRENIVETCGKCHEGSHRQFAGYLTHATHHDKDRYPILFYTFWFMTTLLLGTLSVAGVHTLLWLPRSWQAMKEHRKLRQEHAGEKMYQRFKPYQRRLHVLVIVSFLSLAITGMALKFSYLGWAQWIGELMGGFETTGYIHRVGAVITFFYFFTHIFFLFRERREAGQNWKSYLFDKNSMLPNMNDVKEAWGTLKWFIGMGPRPQYGRWTYWEKFDYFAVFWGVAIIGTTGLMLWFPEFFTLFLPGWVINVATIIHSDEALLAVAFIFTVHFFNTHFRPDKFPMDTVIFTGRIPVEELKEDRPREYQEVVESGDLHKRLVDPLPEPIVRGMRWFGATALILGLILIILIIYAQIFGYR